MNPFRFYRATSDEAAIEAAANGAVFFAGGTTLVDLMRDHVEQPAALVDINRLPHRQIELTARGLEIGALARMSDLASDPKVAAAYPVIAESLVKGASAQLRNMASIGGNLMRRTRCTYFAIPDRPATDASPDRVVQRALASIASMRFSAAARTVSPLTRLTWWWRWSRWMSSLMCAAVAASAGFPFMSYIGCPALRRTRNTRCLATN